MVRADWGARLLEWCKRAARSVHLVTVGSLTRFGRFNRHGREFCAVLSVRVYATLRVDQTLGTNRTKYGQILPTCRAVTCVINADESQILHDVA